MRVPKYLRKVIHICAEDSPNVIAQEDVIPGVLSYDLYLQRRKMWDPMRQCIGLDGQFYLGSEALMFPTDWLNASTAAAKELEGKQREAKAIGVDTAEGGDSTCWCVIDELGIIELISMKTPDTNMIPGKTRALAERYNLSPKQVMFDSGGGGSIHVDRLRANRFPCRTVGFGESANDDKPRFLPYQRRDESYNKSAGYKNRRAQMYWFIREAIDPNGKTPFGIPHRFQELRRQLGPIPLRYDEEGRVLLLPKKTKHGSTTDSLESLLGCSPDEADSLAVAMYAMRNPKAGSKKVRVF